MIWLSVHLFYDGSLDFLLTKGVQPFINKMKGDFATWFFIRYAENGQHIRLRLKINESKKAKTLFEIEKYFTHFFQKFPSKNQVYSPENFPNNSFQFINYKAEKERYGGEFSLEISERLFQYSSEFVLELIDENAVYENKLLLAALMNYNAALIYFNDNQQLAVFFEDIANTWLMFNSQHLSIAKSEIIKQIKAIKTDTKTMIQPLLSDYLDNYKRGIEDDFSDWRKQNLEIYNELKNSKSRTKPILTILESHIHLNNNRLGISNFDESLVSDLLIWKSY